jgi:hypothetical protein
VLFGEGDVSALYALDVLNEALYLRGSGSQVRRLLLTGVVPTVRQSPWQCSRVVARSGCTDWVIDEVTVETGSAAGLVSEGASFGRITRCRVHDTLADAIHMTNQSHNIEVAFNVVERPGDDGIACVSYQDNGGKVHNVHAHHNRIRDQLGGRGMSVVGGKDIVYEFNMLSNNLSAAGIYLAQENSWETYGCENVIARRNSLHNCGGADKDHAAVMIFSGAFEKNTNVTVERNVIVFDDDVENKGGIRDYSEDVGCVFDSNVMMGCTPSYRINEPELFEVYGYTEGPVGVAELPGQPGARRRLSIDRDNRVGEGWPFPPWSNQRGDTP